MFCSTLSLWAIQSQSLTPGHPGSVCHGVDLKLNQTLVGHSHMFRATIAIAEAGQVVGGGVVAVVASSIVYRVPPCARD